MRSFANGHLVDAKSAFEWLMNDGFNSDAEPEYSNLVTAFSSYLDQDFESAQRYAEAHQGASKHKLIEGIVRYLIDTDPDRAIEYLPKVRKVDVRGYSSLSVWSSLKLSRSKRLVTDRHYLWIGRTGTTKTYSEGGLTETFSRSMRVSIWFQAHIEAMQQETCSESTLVRAT